MDEILNKKKANIVILTKKNQIMKQLSHMNVLDIVDNTYH